MEKNFKHIHGIWWFQFLFFCLRKPPHCRLLIFECSIWYTHAMTWICPIFPFNLCLHFLFPLPSNILLFLLRYFLRIKSYKSNKNLIFLMVLRVKQNPTRLFNLFTLILSAKSSPKRPYSLNWDKCESHFDSFYIYSRNSIH